MPVVYSDVTISLREIACNSLKARERESNQKVVFTLPHRVGRPQPSDEVPFFLADEILPSELRKG